tara:strand:+ start:283 stop:963 length:681 start_codon:yes stop_codon:yes gene_type:complete
MNPAFNTVYGQLLCEFTGEDEVKKIGVFPGAFKPPHMGHFKTALKACEENESIYIYVSSKERAITTEPSQERKESSAPDSARYNYLLDNPKYTNNLLGIQCASCARPDFDGDQLSARIIRKAISIKDKETIFKTIPEGADKDAIFSILMKSNDMNSDTYGHVSAEQALAIWSHYIPLLASGGGISEDNIHINISDVSPVTDTYDLVGELNEQPDAGNISIRLYVGD